MEYQYYQVQFKFLLTKKILNVDTSNRDNSNWIRNESTASANSQLFNLRKLSQKDEFVLEFEGRLLGIHSWPRPNELPLLRAWFYVVGNEQVFEITRDPSNPDLVHIKGSNGKLLTVTRPDIDHAHASFELPASTKWDDNSAVYLMTLKPDPKLLKICGVNIKEPASVDKIKPFDGTKVRISAPYLKKSFGVQLRGQRLIAASSQDDKADTFEVWAVPKTDKYIFRVSDGRQFMGIDSRGNLVAVSNMPGEQEAFTLVQDATDYRRVRIKAANGRFLETKNELRVSADASNTSEFIEGDPSVFSLTVVGVVTPDITTMKAIENAAEKLMNPPLPPQPNTEGVVKLGPWGGRGGNSWDIANINNTSQLKEIVIRHSIVIDSLAFQYETDGIGYQGPTMGGNGGSETKIALGDGEYLTSVTWSSTNGLISSLAFTTNTSKTFGPYGEEGATPFVLPLPNGRIVGFYGYAGQLLDGIGFYAVQNQSS